MALAIESQGCVFSASQGSPIDYVPVGAVTAIRDLRSGSGAEIDVTNLQSDAKEFLLGLKDEGSMSLDLFFYPDDNGQALLESLRDARAAGEFQIALTDGSPPTMYQFQGFVTTFPFSIGVDAAITGSVTIRVTGEIEKV